MHAPTDNECDTKDTFLWGTDKFINTDTKIALGDSNAKVGREDIFKPIIGNESLH